MGKLIGSKSVFLFFPLLLLSVVQCTHNPTILPDNVLGIRVGMGKAEAQKHLEEIAVFERDERKRQQIWKVKDSPRFNYVAVGYDENDKIRYVTAFVDKETAKERIRFSDVGDLEKAKKEIVEPHYRYIWEVPASDDKPAYIVMIYGDNPEFVLHYSLSKAGAATEKEEERD